MDKKKFIELQTLENGHWSRINNSLKATNEDRKRQTDELKIYTDQYFKALEVRMEKFSEDFVYKSIHSYDKKVKDELSMAKHYLKEYAGSRD